MNEKIEKRSRTRIANWLQSEKELLLSLVKMQYSIIGNKKTDTVSNNSKQKSWKIISAQYNNRRPHIIRTAKNLQVLWNSLKVQARQAAVKRQLNKTDGSSQLIEEDPLLNQVLDLINTTAVGINNQYESDSDERHSPLTVEDQKLLPTSTTNTQEILNHDSSSNDIHFIDVSVPEVDTEDIESDEFMQEDWDEYLPKTLRTPLTHVLQIENKKKASRKHEHSYSKKTEAHIEQQDSQQEQNNIALEEKKMALRLHDLEVQIKEEKLKQEKLQTSILMIKRQKLLSWVK